MAYNFLPLEANKTRWFQNRIPIVWPTCPVSFQRLGRLRRTTWPTWSGRSPTSTSPTTAAAAASHRQQQTWDLTQLGNWNISIFVQQELTWSYSFLIGFCDMQVASVALCNSMRDLSRKLLSCRFFTSSQMSESNLRWLGGKPRTQPLCNAHILYHDLVLRTGCSEKNVQEFFCSSSQ